MSKIFLNCETILIKLKKYSFTLIERNLWAASMCSLLHNTLGEYRYEIASQCEDLVEIN